MTKGIRNKERNWWLLKAPTLLKKKYDYVIDERIKNGKNKASDIKSGKLSYKRIALASARDDEHIRKLIQADFIEDTKGQTDIFRIFTFVIVAFVAVLMFGGMIYVMGLLNNTFEQVGVNNEVNSGQPGYVNLTQASQHTFGQVNSSIQALRLVAITLIFAEILLIFIMNSFTRVHPAMFFVWVFIVFLAVWLAAPVANAYESILQQRVYGGLLESFTGANWLILNLPLLTLLVGIMGGVFMFINIVRGGNEEAL